MAIALPIERFGEAVRAAQSEKSSRQIIKRDENYRLWSILRAWKVVQEPDQDVRIEINALRMLEDAEAGLPCSFSRDGLVFDGPSLSLTPQQLYQAFSTIEADFDNKKLDAIRPYFNSLDIRKRIDPIEIEHKRARSS